MKKNPIRVLHIRNCRGITTLTGPETYLLDLLRDADPGQVDLRVACLYNPAKEKPIFLEALEATGAAHLGVGLTTALTTADVGICARYVIDEGVDLIHCHDARSDIVGLLVARRTGRPLIAFAHGWVNWDSVFSKARLYAALEVFAVRRADCAVVASKAMHRDLIGRGIPEKKIELVQYGIDVDRFSVGDDQERVSVREEFGLPPACPLVGTIGRMHPWKGHQYLMEAAAEVVKEVPELRVMLVGDVAFDAHGDFRQELESLIRRLGIEENVILTGSRTDVPRLLRSMDIFALPSLREPFGIVSIEAQACGVPVVGSDVDGIPETMVAGVTGVLVPPADSRALARALCALLEDPVGRRAMGEAGRRHVVEHYATAQMVARSTALYQRVFAACRGDEDHGG